MFVKVVDFWVTFSYTYNRKRKENKKMTLAVIIMIIWLTIGVVALINEKKNDNLVWLVIYISLIPFFPWIFKFCGII